jgi:hypothetical protein
MLLSGAERRVDLSRASTGSRAERGSGSGREPIEFGVEAVEAGSQFLFVLGLGGLLAGTAFLALFLCCSERKPLPTKYGRRVRCLVREQRPA